MAEVLIAGTAVADIVLQVSALPRRAEKNRASDAAMTVGGCAANAAMAVARHGGAARLAAPLGRDPVGDFVVAALEREGVDLSLCERRAGGRSSLSSICVDADGERQVTNFRGAGLAETLDLAGARPDAVLADNRWPALTATALSAARRLGVPGIVDVEAPVDAGPLRGATHLAFSMQGLAAYAPGLPVEAALARARAEFGAWVAVTDGANGVRFTDGADIAHLPAFAVAAVDTLGAGDVWHGVFALWLAEGAAEREAIRAANAAAAIKCKTFGGAAGCPDRAATETLTKETA